MESAKVSHKRVFALFTPEIHSYEMAQMLQKPVFALPGCQRTSVNTLLCVILWRWLIKDTLTGCGAHTSRNFSVATCPENMKRALYFGFLFKNLLMPLFLMGCFPVDFQELQRPLMTKSVKRPIKAGKRPINEGKRPINAKVLVGVSVGCLMGCFWAPPPWRKTAPLKGPLRGL